MASPNKEYEINEFITIKLEGYETIIYVAGKKFDHCSALLLNIPIKDKDMFDEIESMDDVAEMLNWDNKIGQEGVEYKVSSETEFFGYCSNLQAWYEHGYNTNLLHSNIAFPLLKNLTDVGDPIAKRVFKKDIMKRFESEDSSVITFLGEEGFLNYFDKNELLGIVTTILENNTLFYGNYKMIFSILEKLSKSDSKAKNLLEEGITKMLASGVPSTIDVLSIIKNFDTYGYLNYSKVLRVLEKGILDNYKTVFKILEYFSRDSEALKLLQTGVLKGIKIGDKSIRNYIWRGGYLNYLNKKDRLNIVSPILDNETELLDKYKTVFKILETLSLSGFSEAPKLLKKGIYKLANIRRSFLYFLHNTGYLRYLESDKLFKIFDELTDDRLKRIVSSSIPKYNSRDPIDFLSKFEILDRDRLETDISEYIKNGDYDEHSDIDHDEMGMIYSICVNKQLDSSIFAFTDFIYKTEDTNLRDTKYSVIKDKFSDFLNTIYRDGSGYTSHSAAILNLVIRIDEDDYLIDLIPIIKKTVRFFHMIPILGFELVKEKIPLIKERFPEYMNELEEELKEYEKKRDDFRWRWTPNYYYKLEKTSHNKNNKNQEVRTSGIG